MTFFKSITPTRPIITFTEALKRNLPTYYIPVTCKYGHDSEKQTSDCSCMECLRIYGVSNERDLKIAISKGKTAVEIINKESKLIRNNEIKKEKKISRNLFYKNTSDKIDNEIKLEEEKQIISPQNLEYEVVINTHDEELFEKLFSELPYVKNLIIHPKYTEISPTKPVIDPVKANKRKLKTYYTAITCAHGHDSERYLTNSACVICEKLHILRKVLADRIFRLKNNLSIREKTPYNLPNTLNTDEIYVSKKTPNSNKIKSHLSNIELRKRLFKTIDVRLFDLKKKIITPKELRRRSEINKRCKELHEQWINDPNYPNISHGEVFPIGYNIHLPNDFKDILTDYYGDIDNIDNIELEEVQRNSKKCKFKKYKASRLYYDLYEYHNITSCSLKESSGLYKMKKGSHASLYY